MLRCARCTAIYSGTHYKGLCSVCADRLSRKFYADPTAAAAFTHRQQQRLDGHRGIIAEYNRPRLKGVSVTYGLTGICAKCNHPIDDHNLTHDKAPYPVAICPAKPAAPPPPPEKPTEPPPGYDSWMYD